MTSWPAKLPGETLDYSVDWSARLAEGDTIVSASFSEPVGLTLETSDLSGATSSAWFSGGIAGARYEVLCTITTAAARIHQVVITLPLADG